MTDSPLHSLTLRTPGISGHGTEVYLDGQKVKGTTHVSLEIGLNEANRLTLTLLVDGINAEGFAKVEEIRTHGDVPPRPAEHGPQVEQEGSDG